MRKDPRKTSEKDSGSESQLGVKRDWSQFNGPAFLVTLLRSVDPVFRTKLLAKLREVAPLVAAVSESFEFVFEDLGRVEVKSLARVWASVSEKDMLLAWKMTSEPLREHLLRGLSERRRGDFTDAFESQVRVPKVQVVRVQMRVAAQVHKLAREGKISLTTRRFGANGLASRI